LSTTDGAVLADLHMHTLHSWDCTTSIDDLLDAALAAGLGALAVTDHNTIAGGVEARARAIERGLPLHVVVGSELKTAADGEIIGLFLHDEIPRGLTFGETIAAIRAQGGVVYVPHPFDRFHTTPEEAVLREHVGSIDVL
jgi:predicted metal-dependent phosphoesterase TrpH